MSFLINPYRFAAAGATDPNFSNVSLLLHGDGTNGSTTITDSSGSPKTVTAFGNAQISTAQSKFGGASIAFDGNGDYLTVPDSTAFNLGTGDFTIEAFTYTPNTTGFKAIVSKLDNGYGTFILALNGSSFVYYMSSNGTSWNVAQNVSGGTFTANTWNHVALVRNGSTFTPYLNGTAGTTTTFSGTLSTNTRALHIGADFGGVVTDFMNGYIDELRITKGVARYTANFTPPTAPFPDS
jgi:hypothetical protein